MSICVAAAVESWEIASQLADDPADLTDVLKELSTRDPASLGRECAEWSLKADTAEIAAWLHDFADAFQNEAIEISRQRLAAPKGQS